MGKDLCSRDMPILRKTPAAELIVKVWLQVALFLFASLQTPYTLELYKTLKCLIAVSPPHFALLLFLPRRLCGVCRSDVTACVLWVEASC